MTADSELFVTETVCHVLEQKIRKLIPRGCYIYLRVPPGWRDIWDASGFPGTGNASVILTRADHKVETLGRVSWDTKFTVADYGGPAKAIEAWPVNLKFERIPVSPQSQLPSGGGPSARPP